MLNSTPRGERLYIGFFGARNAGKSSLVNAVTAQEMSIVSDTLGTTTDPVLKPMELLPLGAVTIIDTPGFDDEGVLGEKRILKTKQILNKTDIAVLVTDAAYGLSECDNELIRLFKEKSIPYIVAYNKADLLDVIPSDGEGSIYVSAKSGHSIKLLKEMIGQLAPKTANHVRIVGDIIKAKDTVVLVTPIDSAAPKGRIILPQQQALRDILDSNATAIVCQPSELEATIKLLKTPPSLVICDSQVFKLVAEIVPEAVPLTSFSILFARYKGLLNAALVGAEYIDRLKDGDTVLISEGCTHHRQCDDIGTVKLPNLLKAYTGKELSFEFSSGGGFPDDLSLYTLIIHCGGCMLNEREILYRQKCACDQNIPITNYGTAIAHMNGILKRSTEILRKL